MHTSWKNHAHAFLGNRRENIVAIRYEDVRINPYGSINEALTSITESVPEKDVVAFSVERNEFCRQTGRLRRVADNKSTKRQGIAGAWKRDLPPVLAERMSHDLEAEMSMAGYTV